MCSETMGSSDGWKWNEISFDKKMTRDEIGEIYAYFGIKDLNWYIS